MSSQLKNYWRRFTKLEQKLLLVFFLVIIVSSIAWREQSLNGATLVPKPGGEYTEGLVGSPNRINPLLSPANDVDADLVEIIFDGLYEFDQNLNLVPNLAAAMPEISAGGTEYLITLKDNILWHDGEPLTAEDVVYTYQAIQNSEFASPLRFSWNRVEVEKVEDLKVRVVIKESSATFISNLTVGILPKHIWENVESANFGISNFNLEPVGNGPFQLSEVSRGRDGDIRNLTLKAFENYHKERPFLDELHFKFYETTDDLISAYQSRNIDGLGYVPFDRSLFIKPRSSLNQTSLPLPQYQAVFFNQQKNPAALGDVNVRLALAKSVDKQKIIEEVYGGEAQEAYGPILPGHLGYHPQIPGADMNIYDVEQAKTLLEESGWQMDEEVGFRKDDEDRIITVELVTNNFSPNVRVAELLEQMWEDIGVQVILRIEALADLEENFIRPRNYELLLFSENVGADPDPFPFWHSSQVRDPGLNLTSFAVSEADNLLVSARSNQSAESRAEKYIKFQELFVGQVPAVFIARNVFVYNLPEKIKGTDLNAVVTPADRFANIENWYINTRKIKN